MEYNKLDHYHNEAKNWIVVNWNLGNMCNFSCSYCPEILHNGSFGWNDFDVVKDFVDAASEYFSPKNIYFEFTGGEVTLWKDFVKLAKYIKSIGNDIGFISNASRTLRWWEENKGYFDHVCLSFHAELSDSDHFIRIVDIMNATCRTHANVMMHHKEPFWSKAKLVAEYIKGIPNLSIAIQPLIIDFGDNLFPYTKEQLDYIYLPHSTIIEDDGIKRKLYRGAMKTINTKTNESEPMAVHRFISAKTNNWEGWNCWAGLEQFIIDFDGSIWRGWCRVGGSFGNIKNSDKIYWPINSVVCNKSHCHCNFDIMCKKEKNADKI